ncbi:MAG TPA: CHASE3 domain-containing protein [Leptolyngbyaceae cyanobacterium]
MKWSIDRKTTAGFGVALAALVGIGAFSFLSLSRLKNTSNQVEHTYKVINKLGTLVSQLTDAETGQRGYLLTGELRYLKPYNNAIASIDQNLDELQELTANNPDQQQRITQLSPLITFKQAELKETITLRQSQGYEAALRVVKTDRGKQAMEEIRAIIKAMEDEELQLLKQRSEQQQAQRTLLTISGSLIGVLSLGGAVLLLNRNVLQRRQSEKTLESTEQKFRQMAENIHEVFWMSSADLSEVLYISPAYQQIWGRTCDSLYTSPKSFLEVIHPEDRERVIANLQQNSKTEFDIEYRIIWQDGTIRWIWDRSVPIYNQVGEVYRRAGIAQDISDRKQAEQKIRFQSRLLDAVEQAVIATDLEGNIIYWNHYAEVLYGWSAVEVMGRLVVDVVPAPSTKEQAAELMSRLQVGESWSGEFLVQRRDGTTFPAMVFDSPIYNEQGSLIGIVGVSVDITERKRAEEELQRSNAELQQFAYVASHDLQEPLRMVSSYTQLLAECYQGQLDAQADKFIAFATEGATRMQQLLEDLLDYSRVSRRPQPFDRISCTTILKDVLTDLAVTMQESSAVVTGDPLPTVLGDRTQLRQLLQNLISNAIKFRREEPPVVHISAEPQEDFWLFTVRDNGIGIDPQFAERIFVLFQRLHSRQEYPGTGIGLAICKKIVERHGGRIWVESHLGGGSAFYFTLPRQAQLAS